MKSYFGSLSKPLLHTFRLSLEQGIFLDDLKTAKVTPIFKVGDKNNFVNYRPISTLSSFSKTLEKIMYKRIFNHLSKRDLLYQKQFDFQQGHSTKHAEMQLIDQINDEFENNCFTLDVFIDLSKAFDIGNLISKLENYVIPQGSIFGPLSFLIYINDPCNGSNILDLIMFAVDSILFLYHQAVNTLFEIFNEELKKLRTASRQTNYH